MSRPRTRLLAAPASAALLVLLAACSGGSVAASDDTTDSTTTQDAPTGDGERQGGAPGVTGEIAAVSDALLQVQGDDGQTAVRWDDTTALTQTVAAALADVRVGSCVTALGASEDDGSAATSVAVTSATDGECTGFGMPGGGMPGGGGGEEGERPEGAPDGMPTDAPADGEVPDLPDGAASGAPDGEMPSGGFGSMTAGLVTAVDATTITVEATDGTTSTITVDDATTYTATVAADASAITVGRCVTAQGEADSSGQVAATSLLLSDATDDGCSTGFGGMGGGMGGGRPGAGSDGAGTTGDEGSDA